MKSEDPKRVTTHVRAAVPRTLVARLSQVPLSKEVVQEFEALIEGGPEREDCRVIHVDCTVRPGSCGEYIYLQDSIPYAKEVQVA